MGALPRIALAASLALIGCGDKGDSSTGKGGPVEPTPAELRVPGEGLVPGKYYRVVHVAATIADRKALGLKWDVVGPAAPDARFDIFVTGDKRGTCRGDNNSHKAACSPENTVDFRFDKNTTLSVNVYDRDVSGDELIGQGHLTKLDTEGKPGPDLPIRTTGGLTRLSIKLIEIDAPKSLWGTYRVRVLGLLGGVGGALLLMFVLKGFWFDDKHYLWPRTIGKLTEQQSGKLGSLGTADINQFEQPRQDKVVEVVKVRCQYCAALLNEDDHTCHKCGGSA